MKRAVPGAILLALFGLGCTNSYLTMTQSTLRDIKADRSLSLGRILAAEGTIIHVRYVGTGMQAMLNAHHPLSDPYDFGEEVILNFPGDNWRIYAGQRIKVIGDYRGVVESGGQRFITLDVAAVSGTGVEMYATGRENDYNLWREGRLFPASD